MVIRSSIAAAAALLLVGQVHAGRTGYDVQQNILTIPSIELEGVRYNFPKVRIVSVEVIDAGITSQVPSGFPICTSARDAGIPITQAKLDQVKLGMSLDEVNQIVGCQYEPPVMSIYDHNLCRNLFECSTEPNEIFTWYGASCGDYCMNSISVSVDIITRRVIEKSGIFRQ